MQVLIYDDSMRDVDNIKNCLKNFFAIKQLEYSIDVCASKKQLFTEIKNYDFLFLDIEIAQDNGIEIGMDLQKIKMDCRIIIVTNYAKYAIDGYKIGADRYFIKPIDQDEFNLEMNYLVDKYYKQHLGFYDTTIKQGKIYFKDIVYIESIERKTAIHFLNNDVIKTTYSLKYWDDKLKSLPFAQSYISFIVNLDYISGFQGNEIIMINEELIPISRHYKKSFELSYENNLHNSF